MSIILSKPIKRGDQEITTITINDNSKQAGSLRGLRLVDVLNLALWQPVTLPPSAKRLRLF